MRGCTSTFRGCSRTLKTPNSPPLVTMAIHVCFDVSSPPQLKGVSLQFFLQDSAWTPPTRRTPPFANALVATHHSPIVCRFTAGSGAGDRGAGPAAGGPRPNPELRIEKPDRRPAARGCVQCRRIEEPGGSRRHN